MIIFSSKPEGSRVANRQTRQTDATKSFIFLLCSWSQILEGVKFEVEVKIADNDTDNRDTCGKFRPAEEFAVLLQQAANIHHSKSLRDVVQSFGEIRYLEFIPDRFTPFPPLAILNPIFTICNTYHTFQGEMKQILVKFWFSSAICFVGKKHVLCKKLSWISILTKLILDPLPPPILNGFKIANFTETLDLVPKRGQKIWKWRQWWPSAAISPRTGYNHKSSWNRGKSQYYVHTMYLLSSKSHISTSFITFLHF